MVEASSGALMRALESVSERDIYLSNLNKIPTVAEAENNQKTFYESQCHLFTDTLLNRIKNGDLNGNFLSGFGNSFDFLRFEKLMELEDTTIIPCDPYEKSLIGLGIVDIIHTLIKKGFKLIYDSKDEIPSLRISRKGKGEYNLHYKKYPLDGSGILEILAKGEDIGSHREERRRRERS